MVAACDLLVMSMMMLVACMEMAVVEMGHARLLLVRGECVVAAAGSDLRLRSACLAGQQLVPLEAMAMATSLPERAASSEKLRKLTGETVLPVPARLPQQPRPGLEAELEFRPVAVLTMRSLAPSQKTASGQLRQPLLRLHVPS